MKQRSKTSPYHKNVWGIFCNEAARFQDPLHEVSTENSGISLKKAIEHTDDVNHTMTTAYLSREVKRMWQP